MSNCNCEDIIIKISEEGVDGNGIVNIELISEVGLEKTYRINFTNGTHFDYVVTDGSSIQSIEKTSTQGLVDTYTITLTDGETFSFEVVNGNGIASIVKTKTENLTDTYTISFTDGTSTTFTVNNGNSITGVTKVSTQVLTDTYRIGYSDTGKAPDTFTVVNGRGITAIAKVSSSGLQDEYRISYNDGTSSNFTVTNGMPATHSWNGTILTITSASGTSSADLKGDKGDSATIAIGTVTTGAEGSSASVTNRGDEHDAIWDITIPRGNTGNGIQSITLLSQSGLVKTYRITYTNGTHFDFSVSDGNGIASIEKTATQGAVDTYTVTFTDPQAEPFSYDVTNGSDEWGAIVGDIADQTDLQAALDTKAPVIVESASGDLVTITDGADLPVESLSVNVEPVQDLHGQANPYPAGGGDNKFNEDTVTYGNWIGSDGTVDTNALYSCQSTKIPVSGGSSVSLRSFGTSGEYAYSYTVSQYDNSDVFIKREGQWSTSAGGSTYTMDSNASYIVVCVASWSNNTKPITAELLASYKVCLVLSRTIPTDYIPYKNICPITGWTEANVTRTGVNLFDKEHLEIFANPMSDGDRYGHTFKKAGTYAVQSYGYDSSQTLYIYAKIRGADGAIKPTTYYIRALAVSTPAIITITEGEILYVYDATSTYSEQQALNHLAVADVQVAYQFTQPDTYQPYQGQQVTIDLDGTRYGGELDVTRGEMLVTMAMTDLGTRTWTYQTSYGYMHSSLLDAKAIGATKVSMICSNFKVVPFSERSSYTTPIVTFDGTNKILQVRNTGYTDATAFKTALNGVQLVYPLAQPFEVTLTPTQISSLIGTNNIWADAGALDVRYRADTGLYVDRKIAEATTAVKRIITTTTTEMKAPKNLTSGEIVIVNDDLYKATANIASGATLTVGSNVVKVTLAEWVASLVA